jgi:hypothetical protein
MNALKRCIAAEWLKLRHSRIWIILAILPVISVLIGGFNFSMNQGVLTKEWYSLWSQVGLFYGEFFFPVLIAIVCAYMWRLEHLNKNWHLIMTAPVSAAHLFLAKWIVAGALLLMVQLFFSLLYVLAGMMAGITSALPAELPGWLARGWISALSISSLQLAISALVRSFAAPIGIGLCASFLGLGMYVFDLGLYFPHSLLTVGMGVLSQTGLPRGELALYLAMNGLYMAAPGAWVIRRMRTSDVVSST